MSARFVLGLVGVVALICAAGGGIRAWQRMHAFAPVPRPFVRGDAAPAERLTGFQRRVVADLERQVRAGIVYRDGYYAGGDPPADRGVCADVLIRSYRAAGVDLRSLLAHDVARAPVAYGVSRPDRDIDHRRCRNLIVFFRRHARKLPADGPGAEWQPGDVVFWSTRGDGRTDHVGLVGCDRDPAGQPAVVQHWPGMVVAETDGLHRFAVTGHFRWPEPREPDRTGGRPPLGQGQGARPWRSR